MKALQQATLSRLLLVLFFIISNAVPVNGKGDMSLYLPIIDPLFSAHYAQEIADFIRSSYAHNMSLRACMNYLVLRYPAVARVHMSMQKNGKHCVEVVAKQPICSLNHQYMLTADSFFLYKNYSTSLVQKLPNLVFLDRLTQATLLQVVSFVQASDALSLHEHQIVWRNAYDIVVTLSEEQHSYVITSCDKPVTGKVLEECAVLIEQYKAERLAVQKLSKKKKEKQYVCDMRFAGQHIVYELEGIGYGKSFF